MENLEEIQRKSVSNGESGLLVLVLGFVLVAHVCTLILSPEYFNSLTIGHWIHAQGSVPWKNHWTSAGFGVSTYAETWLFDVVLTSLETRFAEHGLMFAKLILLAAIFFSNYFLLASRSKDKFLGFFLATLVFCGIAVNADLKAELLAWALFPLLLELGFRGMDSGSKLNLFSIFVVGVLVANCTDSGLFLLLTLVFFVEGKLSRRKVGMLGVYSLSLVVSPYFGSQIIGSLTQFSNKLRYELLLQPNPATVFDYRLSFLLILLSLLALLYPQSKKLLNTWQVWVFAAVCLLGFASKDYLPWAIILAGLASALSLRDSERSESNLLKALSALKAKVTSIYQLSPSGFNFVLLCMFIVDANSLWRSPTYSDLFPAQVADFILEHKYAGPVLASSDAQPYLRYRFASTVEVPKVLLTVDEKSKSLDPRAAADAKASFSAKPAWSSFLNLHKPELIVVRSTEPLYFLLENHPDWQRLSVPESESVERKGFTVKWAIFAKR